MKLDLTLELNLVEYLIKSEFESVNERDLKKIFWINKIIKPTPNSTADRTKNRKVKESKFKLSYEIPKDSVKKYRVIHKISAVNNKCKAELTFIHTELKIIIKTIINKFTSPIYISFFWNSEIC